MKSMMMLVAAGLALCAQGHRTTPIDDYVNNDDGAFMWRDTGVRIATQYGGTGYVLNVTSQRWLNTDLVYGPDGDLWTHQVIVVVPAQLRVTNRAMLLIGGKCNDNPDTPEATDGDIVNIDTLALGTGAVAVALLQIPNCRLTFTSDPEAKHRNEDAILSYAWKEFLDSDERPKQAAKWVPRLPMVKAAFKAMQAAQEFTSAEGLANIDGWIPTGASKRGWTTFMAGATQCESCPKIVGIAPLVPVIPSLHTVLHDMWRAYGGWTWAFADYHADGITARLDDRRFRQLMRIVDPIHRVYRKRLAKIPVHVIVASSDEFMMFEWTNVWWKKMSRVGEAHLTILKESDHSMAGGIHQVISTVTNFASSVFNDGTRPTFTSKVNERKGTIKVKVPAGQDLRRVSLVKADTISTTRRDFRFMRLKGAGVCDAPEVDLMNGFCRVPIDWITSDLAEVAPGEYEASVPCRESGWTGFFIELEFGSDTGLPVNYYMTTPGLVWPNTYPFDACHGAECLGTLV